MSPMSVETVAVYRFDGSMPIRGGPLYCFAMASSFR